MAQRHKNMKRVIFLNLYIEMSKCQQYSLKNNGIMFILEYLQFCFTEGNFRQAVPDFIDFCMCQDELYQAGSWPKNACRPLV